VIPIAGFTYASFNSERKSIATRFPKDPIHDVEGGVYKLVGFLSTLIVVGESFVSKVSKVRWEVKIALVAALLAVAGWAYISKGRNRDPEDSE
jgi:hypothetical protein